MNRMDPKEETQAIIECKTELASFAKIYDAYVKDVYRYVYSRLGNKTETEDITSETFLKAIEKFSSYKHEDGKTIKWWLFAIARNLMIDKFRKKEMLEFNEEYTAWHDEKILDAIADRDQITKIEEFIKTFKPPVPEIIQLRLWEELSFEEISIIVGKPTPSIKLAYYRAIANINVEFIKSEEKING